MEFFNGHSAVYYHDIKSYDISKISNNDWNNFLKLYDNQSTVFHTKEWMLALQDAYGYEPKYLIDYIGDTIVNVIPYMIDKRYGIKNYLSMPFDTYGGVIGCGDKDPIIKSFKKLSGIGIKYFVSYYPNYYTADGFKSIKVETELKDISMDIIDIWNGLHKDNRTSIRYAQKHEVIIENIVNSNIFDKIDINLYNAIVKNMPQYHVSFMATIGKFPAAASIFFIYGDMMMYWTNTTTSMGRSNNANYLLLWEAIKYAKSHGCTVFNFGASPKGADSLIKFKKAWGTKTYEYVKYQHTPLLIKPILKIKELI